jgi:hypothetical protein
MDQKTGRTWSLTTLEVQHGERMASGKNRLLRAAGWLVPLLGIGLQAYITSKSNGGLSPYDLQLFFFASLPYTLCLLVDRLANRPLPAALAGTCCLALDLLAYHAVFIAPTSSTAPLALFFIPLWNLLIVAPFVLIVSELAIRAFGRRGGK